MFKIDGDLQFLKDDRFSSGNANIAKIYEHLLSTNILGEKRRDSFDPQRANLLGKDSMVNLLETPRVIVFFFITCSLFTVSLTYLIEIRREAQGKKCSKKP